MDITKQLEFIPLLNLKKLTRCKTGYKFICHHCNDRKQRGYVLVDWDKITVYCHHCNLKENFRKYLELFYPSIYEDFEDERKKEYIEKVKAGNIKTKKSFSVKHDNTNELQFKFYLSSKYFIPAKQSKKCVDYCKDRNIPSVIFERLKYNIHPDCNFSDMLIFPWYIGDSDLCYGFQGRIPSKTEKRFITYSSNESFKIYNIFNVNTSSNVYIFESIIDSFYMPNSIAMCGSSLSDRVNKMLPYKIYIFDNDLHKDRKGIKQALEYVKNGHKVLVWPKDILAKDTNELSVKYKWTDNQIRDMILGNIQEGNEAFFNLNMKLRGKR